MNTTMPAVTAPALVRRIVPRASTPTAVIASRAPVPAMIRIRVSGVGGEDVVAAGVEDVDRRRE